VPPMRAIRQEVARARHLYRHLRELALASIHDAPN
jgi:hypothetical protein